MKYIFNTILQTDKIIVLHYPYELKMQPEMSWVKGCKWIPATRLFYNI